ncbi:hypothetical protein [Rhodopirellula sallentina]|uniref:Putative secreted protein n=1 Tax=Rhodopirellula sallentina SM41 TaxID=1263870 RepID=M5U795_9BACT|nr:hypothetical protein [Rhodopirellula sallentina]EMI53731.1 putative secreted protein [Rhodopirellula sallentina SM41]
MSKYRRYGLLFLLAIVIPSLGWRYLSPNTAQALGVPLSWVGLSDAAVASDSTSLDFGDSVETLSLDGEVVETLPVPAGADGSFAISESGMTVEHAVASPAMYTQNQVMRWAYDRSPEAALIEAEVDAVLRGIDPKDPDACCSARLIRNVLREVALARRYDDATHAVVAYHKLIAATQAVEIAEQAIQTADQLISMADQAERLELPDGDPIHLRQTRLDLVTIKTEQSFNTLKLRQELSRLTGREEAEVAHAIMMDALPVDAPTIIAGEAVAVALVQRRDLRAVQVLCRELRSCNVDAARLLMGIVSPGVGLSLATASKGLFQCLKEDRSDDDLHARRRQCSQLCRSLEVVIRNETLQAVLDVRSAAARLKLVDQQIDLAHQRLEEARGRIEIDEETPGTDLALELEIFEYQAKRIALQKDLALALDDLDHARSMPIGQ